MEEVENILKRIPLQLGEKWSYDPHHIISNKRVENSYAPYTHESHPEIEKLENGGQIRAQGGIEIETPDPIEKGLKRGSGDIIDLESEAGQGFLTLKKSLNIWLGTPQLQSVFNFNWEMLHVLRGLPDYFSYYKAVA